MQRKNHVLGEKPTKEQLQHLFDGFSEPIPPTTREQVADCIDRYYVMLTCLKRINPTKLSKEVAEYLRQHEKIGFTINFPQSSLSNEAMRFLLLNAPSHLDDHKQIAQWAHEGIIKDMITNQIGGRPSVRPMRALLFAQLRTILVEAGIKVSRSYSVRKGCNEKFGSKGLEFVFSLFKLLHPDLEYESFRKIVKHKEARSAIRSITNQENS